MQHTTDELLSEPPQLATLDPPARRIWRFVHGSIIGILLCSILGFYAVVQYRAFVPAYAGPDPDGYIWLAKRMAHFQSLHEKPDNPFRFQSHVWVENPDGFVTPKFAPGFSLVMAPFSYVGDEAMFWVSPLAEGLALLGVFGLFCRWMNVWISLLATLVVSINPILIYYAGCMLSHAVDLCALSWGMLFLFAWMEKPTRFRGWGAGLILGFAVAIRHVNILLSLCLLVAILAVVLQHPKTQRRPWQAIITLLGAYLIFPLLLLLYNKLMYGSAMSTGYALSNEQSAFSLKQLQIQWQPFLCDAFKFSFFMVLPLGLLGAILVGPWHSRLIRLLWLGPISAVYAGYYWYHSVDHLWSWNYFRFVLPMSVVLTGCAFMLIERVAVNKWMRAVAMLVLAAMMGGYGWPMLKNAWGGSLHGGFPVSVANMDCTLRHTIHDDAVIFTTSHFADCTGMMRSYTLYDLSTFDRDRALHHLEESLEFLQQDEFNPREPRRQIQRLQQLCDFYSHSNRESLAQAENQIIDQAMVAAKQVIFLLPKDQFALLPTNRQITFKLLKECRIVVPVSLLYPRYDGQWLIYEVNSPPATQPGTSQSLR